MALFVQLQANGPWSLAPAFGGFLLAIGLFNLLSFVRLRQAALLIYACALTFALLSLMPDETPWTHELFGWLYFAATAYFARVFLDLREYDPKVDVAVMALVGLSALELVVGFFPLRPFWVDVVAPAFLILLLATLVVAGVRAARRGYRGARFFVVGSAGACIGLTANVIFPTVIVDLYAIGVAWEALWLTVALADRMSEAARENADLLVSRAELQVLAELDPLTGVPNRRSFDDHLQTEWSRAQRAGTSLGVIMLDVDHFKEYNDTLGHVAGDLCLSKIAQACASSLKRSGDFFARYGGEEFAAVLVTQNDADLGVVAERMRCAVAELGMPHPTNPNGVVTISLGVARMRPSPRENPLELVDAADEALYAAKSRGRNQVGTTLLATS